MTSLYYTDMNKETINKADIEMIIKNMEAAGCSSSDIDRARAMHDEGLDKELISCLRKCRCSLVEEMHETQRRVDRMDHLIRLTERG